MNKPLVAADKTADAEIAARILDALKNKKGLTQEALSQEVGISYTTFRRSIEQHRGDARSFSIRELGKIAGALDVPAYTLLPETLVAA